MKHSAVLWVLLRDFWVFLQILKHKNSPGACALFSSFFWYSQGVAAGLEKGVQFSTGQTHEQTSQED